MIEVVYIFIGVAVQLVVLLAYFVCVCCTFILMYTYYIMHMQIHMYVILLHVLYSLLSSLMQSASIHILVILLSLLQGFVMSSRYNGVTKMFEDKACEIAYR